MCKPLGFFLALCIASIGAGAGAQDSQAGNGGTRPQIAYRLFTTWADGYDREAERGKKIGTAVLLSMGGLGLVTAGTTWFYGDDISRHFTGYAMEPSARQGVTLGAGISGAALVVAGLAVNSVKIENQRMVYADIFGENDPEVQEAMAVAALRDQAAKGKERRIASFISSLVVPLLTTGIRVGVNLGSGDPWSKDVAQNFGYSSWSMGSGIIALFSTSKEEQLYERYLTTRDALYGQPVKAP